MPEKSSCRALDLPFFHTEPSGKLFHMLLYSASRVHQFQPHDCAHPTALSSSCRYNMSSDSNFSCRMIFFNEYVFHVLGLVLLKTLVFPTQNLIETRHLELHNGTKPVSCDAYSNAVVGLHKLTLKLSEYPTTIKCWLLTSCQKLNSSYIMLFWKSMEHLLTLRVLSIIFRMNCVSLFVDWKIWCNGWASPISWLNDTGGLLQIDIENTMPYRSGRSHHNSSRAFTLQSTKIDLCNSLCSPNETIMVSNSAILQFCWAQDYFQNALRFTEIRPTMTTLFSQNRWFDFEAFAASQAQYRKEACRMRFALMTGNVAYRHCYNRYVLLFQTSWPDS